VSVIAICNMKGGTGKTLMAITLASYFADKEKGKVLGIDADPQGNMSSFFARVVPDESKTLRLYDTKEGEPDPHPFRVSDRLFLFGSDLRLSAIEPHTSVQDYFALQGWLRRHGSDYSDVIIDSPPNLGLHSAATLLAAQYVLVPVDIGESAIEGLRSLLSSMRTLAKTGNPAIKVLGIVLTRRRQTAYAEDFEAELRAEFTKNVFRTVIPETAAYREYMFRHRPIPPTSRTAQSVHDFVAEVEERIKEAQ